jgi:hypothetical protein
MANEFEEYKTSLTAPARNAAAVTPNDSTDLSNDSRALYVGGAGDLSIVTVGGDTVTLSSVPAGSMLSIMVRRVRATGTTATNIVSLS